MPGRCLARERQLHAASFPARLQRLYETLTSAAPAPERALVGPAAILAFLHDHLALRRQNGQPLRWRQILRWSHDHGFPLKRGFTSKFHRAPPMTTTHAVTAWTLTAFCADEQFSVTTDTWQAAMGRRPGKRSANLQRGKPPWWRPLATVDSKALDSPEASGAMLAAVRRRESVQSAVQSGRRAR